MAVKNDITTSNGGTNTNDKGHSTSSGTISLTPKAQKKETKRKNKEAEAHTKAQQKIANDLSTAFLTGKIDNDVVDKLNENAKNGIDLPAELPYKGSEAEKKFREQYMSETLKQDTPPNSGASESKVDTSSTPKKKSDNDYTYAQVLEMNGGDKAKAEQWMIDHPEYELLDKTIEGQGEESIERIKEARAKKAEEQREIKESANIEKAKDELTTGTEGEINAKVDVLQEKIDDSNNERAKKLANQVDEFMKDDVNDYYIEGLPKGVWRQYKSGAFGYSKEQAQKELDKLHEGEITWSKARRDYLLKHPELANEKEKEIINSYKEAKNTFGTFILDVIANGLSNASKAVMGKDIDLNAGLTAEMMKTNLNKAIERRNEKYGTSHQNQWKALVDSMDLSKEAKQKLQDVNITRGLQKKIAKLDNETQKLTLDFMAKWDFSPKQIAKVIASKEMLSDDPEAVDTVVASLAGDLMNDDGSINEEKVADLAKLFGTSAANIINGLRKVVLPI